MTNDEMFLSVTMNAWKANIERAGKLCFTLTAEQLEQEIAPGKNRLIYLWGHLTAVHDAMLPLLGFGERLHPELDDLFISKPDKKAPSLPSAQEVKRYWDEVNSRLL